MIQIYNFIRGRVTALIREEGGQTGFEYLLVVGGVSIAIVAAIATGALGTGIVNPLIHGIKCAIQGAPINIALGETCP